SRPPSEDLQDEAGAVEHLCAPRALEIALLDGRDRVIDDDELDLVLGDEVLQLRDLPGPEQRSRLRPGDRNDQFRADLEIDGLGNACGPGQPVLGGMQTLVTLSVIAVCT